MRSLGRLLVLLPLLPRAACTAYGSMRWVDENVASLHKPGACPLYSMRAMLPMMPCHAEHMYALHNSLATAWNSLQTATETVSLGPTCAMHVQYWTTLAEACCSVVRWLS